MKTKFSVGDRVVIVDTSGIKTQLLGEHGTIICIPNIEHNYYGVEFDDSVGYAHNCGGSGKYGFCAWVRVDQIDRETSVIKITDDMIDELFG